jgi:hypothetical protein
MYEDYFGFIEKPFSLTPDPKYLYKSESHANAFELLQYAIRRREGFVVVTGDIGTGKTTLCRALLEQIDRRTFTALVLNPFLSEDDLLKLILQDFGVVSRQDVKAGRLSGVSKQDLIDTAPSSSSTRRRTCRSRCWSSCESSQTSKRTRRNCSRSSWSGSSTSIRC